MFDKKTYMKEYWQKYKEEHKEEIKQRNHLYWQSKSGKKNKKRYYKKHQEEIKQKIANYKNQNKDKIQTYNKKYYDEIRNKGIKVWEQNYGKVPKGCLIIHKDNDKNNNSLENLMMITKKELGTMNINKLNINRNKKITEANLLLAKIKNRTIEIQGEKNE